MVYKLYLNKAVKVYFTHFKQANIFLNNELRPSLLNSMFLLVGLADCYEGLSNILRDAQGFL